MAGVSFRELPTRAQRFVGAAVVAGCGITALAVVRATPQIDLRTAAMVAVATAAGLVKVPLPVVGSLSLAHSMVLATLLGFGLGPATFAGFLSAFASSLGSRLQGRRPALHRTAFNAGAIAISTFVAGAVYLALGGTIGVVELPKTLWLLIAYTAVFALVNIGLVAVAIHLSGDGDIGPTLEANLRWAVPGYLAGSAIAALINLLHVRDSLVVLVLGSPFAYLLHSAYRVRARRAEDERRHSLETAELYRGLTEALARAIEAKDDNTENHLQRVQAYCLGVAEAMALPDAEIRALRDAAVLHDIGKIAVPERILAKPGRLTPEEMEAMRVHPIVGAEILGAVPFPYPLTPIVRHHHERWDGSGYPDGLAGDAIPIGARILSVVDCYDALTSERPYREALPREEALAYLRKESGRMFDPRVVDEMVRRAAALESRVAEATRRAAPVEEALAGLPDGPAADPDAPESAAPTARDAPVLFEIARIAALELDVPDRLALLTARLGGWIRFRSLALYRLEEGGGVLRATFASGLGAARLSGLGLRVGERIAGWVARRQEPFVGVAHSDPLSRDGCRSDLEELFDDPEVGTLRAAAAVPVMLDDEPLGVLALYDEAERPFDAEAVRRLSLVSGYVAKLVAPDGGLARRRAGQ